MSRLGKLDPARLAPEQRKIYDDIVSGPRGSIGGPFAPWLRSPILADRAQKLGEFCRFNTSLPKRLSELAILVTARYWKAQFEWYAHEKMAREGGLAQPIIDAIRLRLPPPGMQADEKVVYDFASEAFALHYVSDDTYARAMEILGEKAVVELVGVLGYYCLVSLTLNIFQVGLPEGEKPMLK
jgi:4-carboxymuconolactone decarboxylase